jgi:GNAT superfamily N-acetyltransferase
VHGRGRSDSYLLTVDGVDVGYGSLKDGDAGARDTVFECFVTRPYRKHATALFRALLTTSRAQRIECQSNDVFLSALLFEHASGIRSDTVLYEDHAVTELVVPGAAVRARRDDDRIFEHTVEPIGSYVVETAGEIVATGGFLTHYNPPFADLFMEVRPDQRRRGLGSYLIQEAKKACYLAGRVPAARTGLDNTASRATLSKAGLRVCGFMLIGQVTP